MVTASARLSQPDSSRSVLDVNSQTATEARAATGSEVSSSPTSSAVATASSSLATASSLAATSRFLSTRSIPDVARATSAGPPAVESSITSSEQVSAMSSPFMDGITPEDAEPGQSDTGAAADVGPQSSGCSTPELQHGRIREEPAGSQRDVASGAAAKLWPHLDWLSPSATGEEQKRLQRAAELLSEYCAQQQAQPGADCDAPDSPGTVLCACMRLDFPDAPVVLTFVASFVLHTSESWQGCELRAGCTEDASARQPDEDDRPRARREGGAAQRPLEAATTSAGSAPSEPYAVPDAQGPWPHSSQSTSPARPPLAPQPTPEGPAPRSPFVDSLMASSSRASPPGKSPRTTNAATNTDSSDVPYVLTAVGHSLGGAMLLMYAVASRRTREAHHLSRLVLLTPAGFVKSVPLSVAPIALCLPAITWLARRLSPSGLGGAVMIPTTWARRLFHDLLADLRAVPALSTLVRCAPPRK